MGAHTRYIQCTSPGIAGQRSRPRVVGTVPVPAALSHKAMEEADSHRFPPCVHVGSTIRAGTAASLPCCDQPRRWEL